VNKFTDNKKYTCRQCKNPVEANMVTMAVEITGLCPRCFHINMTGAVPPSIPKKEAFPWLKDKDKWLAGIREAISEGRVYITVSLQISDTGRRKVTGYNYDTGWVTTGKDFWSQRSFMVCPSDLYVVPKEEVKK